MIESFIIGLLMGMVFGLILHEKLFPEHKTVNEISKIKNSTVKADFNNENPHGLSEYDKRPINKRGFLRRIFQRKPG